MKKYRCVFENCSKAFSRPSLLQEHICVHTNTRTFHCSLCTKAYFKRSHLSVHMKSHYPKKFQCTHCARSFATKDKLVRHGDCSAVHICYMCDKVYQKRRCLDKHLERHKQRKIKVHQCSVCKGVYASGKSLRQHSRLHATDNQSENCNNGSQTTHIAHNA
eukprot:jgi/Antlo1/1641/158